MGERAFVLSDDTLTIKTVGTRVCQPPAKRAPVRPEAELRTLLDLWAMTGYERSALPSTRMFARAIWSAAELAGQEGGRVSIPCGPYDRIYDDASDQGIGVNPFA